MSTFRRVTLTIVKAMCPPVSLLLRLADKKMAFCHRWLFFRLYLTISAK